jgi:hypothetical protein
MKLFIPVICYNHTCNTEFMFSLMQLVVILKQQNINTVLYPIVFDSLISRARNAAVAHFLSDPETTHLLFIDSDIEFKVDDVFALLLANKLVVCAGYAQKWLSTEKMKGVFTAPVEIANPLELITKTSVHLLPTETPPDLLMKAKYATTGFLLVHRSVFEFIASRHPELAFQNDIDGYSGANPAFFYDFFPITINPETKRFESEDYGFSRLWTELGGEIYVATNITLKHMGWYGFQANLYRQLTTQI